MFVMTEPAGEYLCAVLDRANAPEEAAIRLAVEGDAIVPKLDKPRPGDAMYDHDGRKVLIMDERVSQLLDGSTLELQPTADGEKLVLSQ
jgi:hypothetical protein